MADTRTPVQICIDKYEAETMLKFRPTDKFFKHLGISYYDFYSIARGERKPYAHEAKRLSQHFEIKIEDFYN